MHFLRKTTLVVAASLFTSSLFSFGLLLGIERTFSTPTAVKQALRESNIYENFAGDALQQIQKEENKKASNEEQLPVEKPAVRAIISNAVSPAQLQTQTERALDSAYNWIGGKSPNLTFNITLGDAKQRLADGLSTYAQQHLASLPACASSTPPPANDDLFALNCVPAGYDVSAKTQEIKQQIVNGDFLKDQSINAGNLKTKDGRTFAEAYHAVPDIYRGVIMGIYALVLVTLLLGVAVVFLSDHWRSGVRKISVVGLSTGAAIALLSWGIGFLLNKIVANAAKTSEGNEPLARHTMEIVRLLAGHVRGWWLGYGLTLLILGIAGLIALHATKPGVTTAAKADPIDPTTDGQSTAPSKQPQEAPTKRPKKIDNANDQSSVM